MLFSKLLPHMKEFGRVGQQILDMKSHIEELNKRTLKFKEYQKSKAELQNEIIRQGAKAYQPPSKVGGSRPVSRNLAEDDDALSYDPDDRQRSQSFLGKSKGDALLGEADSDTNQKRKAYKKD